MRDDENGIGDRTEVVPFDHQKLRPRDSSGAPKKLGRYTLEKIIAQGGMAEIWLAHMGSSSGRDSGFQKKVVVKRVRPSLIKQAMKMQGGAQNRTVEMFVREAHVLARLEHPNIVAVFELGVQPPKNDGELGEHFIVMEYLEGLTLKDLALRSWAQKRPLPIETVVRAVADTCLGLDHAHRMKDDRGTAANLVHRDISPDNLFCTTAGVTKVLDFGIAKREGTTPMTQVGELKGKVPYMAPEQLKNTPLDARTDIWALGVVMYWLLAGRRPFDGPSDIFTMKAILDDDPAPLRSLNPNVPQVLEDVVNDCLHKDQSKRISSAAALHDALSMLLMSVHGHVTSVADLVAAAMPIETPSYELAPDLAAVPSTLWANASTAHSSPVPQALTQTGDGRTTEVRPAPAPVKKLDVGAPRPRPPQPPALADAETVLKVDEADLPSTIPPPTSVQALPPLPLPPVLPDDKTLQRSTRDDLLPARAPDLPPPPVAEREKKRSKPTPAAPPPPPPQLADADTRQAARPVGRDTLAFEPPTPVRPLNTFSDVPQRPQPSTSSRSAAAGLALGATVALFVVVGFAWLFGAFDKDGAIVDAGTIVDAGMMVTAPDPPITDDPVAPPPPAPPPVVEEEEEDETLPTGDPRRRRRRRPKPPPSPPPAVVSGEGYLVVQARPWAKVTIDGLLLGTTPLPAQQLAAGKHKVKLEHESIVKFKEVEISAQRTTTLQIDMRAP